MIPNGNLMNLGAGDCSSQPGRFLARVADARGYDFIGPANRFGESSGSGKSICSAHQSFAQIYREVARANDDAQRSAEKETGDAYSRSIGRIEGNRTCGYLSKDQSESEESRSIESKAAENCISSESRQSGVETAPEIESGLAIGQPQTIAEQATFIIKRSLINISGVLNMKLVDGLNELKISNPDDSLISQFAEIVHMLEQIAKILVGAINQNQSVEIGGQQLAARQLSGIEKTLRVEAFNLQLAFRMLGVSAGVAGEVAEKQNLPFAAGIPQATDLAARSMPAMQVQQLFSELIAAREEELKALLGRVAAILRQEAPQLAAQSNAAITTAQSTDAQSAINRLFFMAGWLRQSGVSGAEMPAYLDASQSQSAGTKSILDVGVFDSLIMRRLLKIDASDSTAAKNLEAAVQANRLDVSKVNGLIFGKDPAAASFGDGAMQTVVFDALAKHGNAESFVSLLGPRLGDLVMKSIEHSVMSQVIEKFNLAVRTGINEMRLVLHPESLGEVRVKIEIHQEVVSAKIQVESFQVKQIVENNLQSLKNALQEQHLQAGSLNVSVGDGSTQREVADSNDRGCSRGGEEEAAKEADADAVAAASEALLGVNTGKRYGDNSIEYFA